MSEQGADKAGLTISEELRFFLKADEQRSAEFVAQFIMRD